MQTDSRSRTGQRRDVQFKAEPWAYLRDVPQRLPKQLNSGIEELLPHRWQPAR